MLYASKSRRIEQMTRGYFKKLLKYMKGVYGIEDELRNLRDDRKIPNI